MSHDRESAMGAASRVMELVAGRLQGDYLQGDLMADATAMAGFLSGIGEQPDREPDNPISPEFLELVGMTDPTGTGRVWVATDVDGCELKFLFDGRDGPEIHLTDDDGDGTRRTAPETEGDFLDLCRLLRFPVELPI